MILAVPAPVAEPEQAAGPVRRVNSLTDASNASLRHPARGCSKRAMQLEIFVAAWTIRGGRSRRSSRVFAYPSLVVEPDLVNTSGVLCRGGRTMYCDVASVSTNIVQRPTVTRDPTRQAARLRRSSQPANVLLPDSCPAAALPNPAAETRAARLDPARSTVGRCHYQSTKTTLSEEPACPSPVAVH